VEGIFLGQWNDNSMKGKYSEHQIKEEDGGHGKTAMLEDHLP